MTPEEIEKRIEAAARRYEETKDPGAKNLITGLTYRLAEIRCFQVLENALARGWDEDLHTQDVDHALGFLEYRGIAKWPFEQFRKALDNGNRKDDGHQQLLAALNEIKLTFGIR